MNVHLYFDKNCGAWVRLPLAWELHSDFVKELMATIHVMLLVLLSDFKRCHILQLIHRVQYSYFIFVQ